MIATARRVARLIAISVWTSFAITSARILAALGRPRYLEGLTLWARGARAILGVRVDLPASPAASPRGRLVIANHRTPLDLIPLMLMFEGHFLANHKTRRAPVIGSAAESVGTVFVDREDRRSGVAAIRQMRRLLESGETVVVFPEGTTHAGDVVRPFQRGAFLAAKGLDVDVIPVGLAYPEGHEFTQPSLGAHARAFLERAANPVAVVVGEPIASKTLETDEAAVHTALQALVHQARARLA